LRAKSVFIYIIGGFATIFFFQNCGSEMGRVNLQSNSGSSLGADTAPIAPSQLSLQAMASNQINLSWNDNSSNESGFRVERASATAPAAFTVITTTGPNVSSFIDNGLAASSTYYYRVSAVNAAGASAPTGTMSASTPATPTATPAAPSGLTATATSSSVATLNWTDNSNNESYFKIERSTDGGTSFSQIAVASANITTLTDINLTPSATYVYRVRATNGAGDSAYTTNASVTMPAAVNMATYSYISANILGPNCVACHGNTIASAGISFANYTATLKTVTKNNAAASALYVAVNGGGMPPGGALTSAQLTAIRTWINDGALNN
jgi:predicted phage tail protein